jgi:hypothetical protein
MMKIVRGFGFPCHSRKINEDLVIPCEQIVNDVFQEC